MSLVLVPTPIGNLKDITLRALEELKNADLILAEDTRTSGVLLKHYEISKPLQSYHIFNEHKTVHKIIDIIKSGKRIALISDAGTPGISDPGFLLVRECIKNDIEIECLPGPTAFVPALILSGFACDRFTFEGFLPVKKGRKTRLESLSTEIRTMVFYESPYRVAKTLLEMAAVFGEDRMASVSRELSKKFEETLRGGLKELGETLKDRNAKGEFVIVVEGINEKQA